ncbi:MAG: UpxY family transcription antiterminator [Culturomica sp.]|jgi:transcription antitermination factor NusG|nr:UpxY family transcription antiterminator [Culturomica sp.]
MNTLQWYAVYTSSRSEKKVKERLDAQKIENYLPLRLETRIWSDRRKKVALPLIPGYIFVCVATDDFLKVLNTAGVVTFLKEKSIPAAIPENQIRRLRMMVEHAVDEIEFVHHSLQVGDKISVEQGELKGLIGNLVEMRGKYKIAIRLQHFGCALTTVPLGWIKKIE